MIYVLALISLFWIAYKLGREDSKSLYAAGIFHTKSVFHIP